MPPEQDLAAAVAWIRTARAVRERCRRILDAARCDELPHFRYCPERMGSAVDRVLSTLKDRYPNLDVPYHSRWRHFDVGGIDRWAELVANHRALPAAEIARMRFDLAVTSVLLDAGAGNSWHFIDPLDGRAYARSEGLAVASFAMFREGLFSAVEGQPYRVDSAALEALDSERLGSHFQARAGNRLLGLDGRCELLRRLGAALRSHPDLFGSAQPRVGNLFDALLRGSGDGAIAASAILTAVLVGLAEVWPDGYRLHGINVGDVGHHSILSDGSATSGLVPFHKLSQWLTYSLVEPLQEYGVAITGMDKLTALAEYRNGGLLIDTGILVPREPDALERCHRMDSELIVEWRALTVALVDEIADSVRGELGCDPETLPLAAVLEGGTWWAGRRIAAELREGGGPPLRVDSAATIF